MVHGAQSGKSMQKKKSSRRHNDRSVKERKRTQTLGAAGGNQYVLRRPHPLQEPTTAENVPVLAPMTDALTELIHLPALYSYTHDPQ